ncbi:LOG family protein [Candidatus Cyanaurora vandensis]|uniref:LOG family protein n=1 Tax=Candidatus Cyanaurora vandensis TaxID=2714958 RepID=UPI00257A3752|nr:LOG family protein [Candidatus Cyanaurora vandensis]
MSDAPEKAYKNLAFLTSEEARAIRILCEYEEPKRRFAHQHVHNTIVFFGSARLSAPDEAQQRLSQAQANTEQNPGPVAQRELHQATTALRLSHYYTAARELARQLTAWSLKKYSGYHYYICSGGGPGIMEAANRGAADVTGGKSIGLGISLPMEQGLNPWVTPELAFEFHYFFTRKYWFLNPCKALVIFPGGFGTLDELFETLTLVQTRKIQGKLPVVLFGKDYWQRVLNLEAMVEFGTISPEDLELTYPTDSVEDAFAYITHFLSVAEDPATPETLPHL